jgi:hypothetical protein
LGQNSEEALIVGLTQTCLFRTDCGSIGIGLFSGCGATVPGGIAMSDIENSLSGNSIALSIDFGNCFTPAHGAGLGIGYNEEGITSIGSSKGSVRGGCGGGVVKRKPLINIKSDPIFIPI